MAKPKKRKASDRSLRIELRDPRIPGGRLSLSARTTDTHEAEQRRRAVLWLLEKGETAILDRLRERTVRVEELARVYASRDRDGNADLTPLRAGKVEAPRKGTEHRTPLLADTIAGLLAELAATKAATTMDVYRYLAAALEKGMGVERSARGDVVRDVEIRSITRDAGATWLHGPQPTNGGEPWGASRQRQAHQLAGQVWERAIAADEERHEIHGTPRTLTRNIWRGLKGRRVQAPRMPKGRVVHFTRSQAARILWANRGRPEAAWMAAGIYASLRAGEKAHLRMAEDVDLAKMEIRVQPREFPHRWRPKTDNSIRTVPVNRQLGRWLRSHIRNGYAGRVYLFRPAVQVVERPLSRSTGMRMAERAIVTAGLPYGQKAYSDHTNRHTFATMHLLKRIIPQRKVPVRGGTPPHVVAEMMGDTVTVLMNTYAHLMQTDKREAVENV